MWGRKKSKVKSLSLDTTEGLSGFLGALAALDEDNPPDIIGTTVYVLQYMNRRHGVYIWASRESAERAVAVFKYPDRYEIFEVVVQP